ncbi:MAG: hypothetical protein HFI67_11720 [Lachnospiraceae bacterium]|jgi:hypothetical protein|nr:hypothetical protein [Lachnospiraceae bacterium]
MKEIKDMTEEDFDALLKNIREKDAEEAARKRREEKRSRREQKIVDILEGLSDSELKRVHDTFNCWGWNKKFGKKPFMYNNLVQYKVPHNWKRRLHMLSTTGKCLFMAVWPFTKEDYIKPIMTQINLLMRERRLY